MTADSKWILSESVGSTALDLNRAKLTQKVKTFIQLRFEMSACLAAERLW